MAKIKFGDYLKSKQRQEAVYESDESIAKRARALIDADSCAVQAKFRVDNYRRAAELLEQIRDYPGAEEMLEECRAGLAAAEADMIQADFESARYHFEAASSEHEYRKASEELAAVSEETGRQEDIGREAARLKARADQQILRYSRKTTVRRWIALAVILGLITAAVYAWVSGYAWYLAAKLEGVGGIYESAYSRFYKLGDYLDSREQYQYYKEKYLRQREQEESRSLPDAEAGDTVEFSGFSWLVLGKEGTELRLLCTAPKEGSAFSYVSYDGKQKALREEMSIEPQTEETEAGSGPASGDGSETEPASGPASGGGSETEAGSGPASGDGSETEPASGSASWENSSLRTYLNETVLRHEFTPAEIAALRPQRAERSSNTQYGTSLDEEAVDLITILSLEQVQSCLEEGVFRKPSADMWMRTPGHDMGSAAYMTANGNVILYGNDVTDDSLSVCPLILVDYAKLEG